MIQHLQSVTKLHSSVTTCITEATMAILKIFALWGGGRPAFQQHTPRDGHHKHTATCNFLGITLTIKQEYLYKTLKKITNFTSANLTLFVLCIIFNYAKKNQQDLLFFLYIFIL